MKISCYLASDGCKTGSLTVREEYRLGLLENRVLRKYQESAKNCVTRHFMICTHQKRQLR
jgi:hypothetical protein